MTLHQLKANGIASELVSIDTKEYQFLWTSGYWDGPISGMLSYNGREYWFEMFRENQDDDSPDTWRRRYALVVLTPEQLQMEHKVNQDFQQHVGRHPKLRPRDNWRLFYDTHLEYCRSRNFGDNEVVAWFER